MDADPRYWAFLSYSHSDARWARWLHRALESFRTPARFVGQPTAAGPAPPRFRPVFRDRAELAADPNLGERIRHCLEHSGFLVVLCSPAAAASPWVEQEIATFKALHGEHRVFAAIVCGEPFSRTPGQECFPRALRYRVEPDGRIGDQRAEPVAADLRPHGDGKRLARLKLLAGMLGIGLDDLVRREHQVRHRRLTILAVASTAGVLVMAGLTLEAVRARNAAEAQRVQAEGLVEFMLTDLRKKLEPAGRLDALDAVGQRALAYYASQNAENASTDPDALGRRARALHLLGDIRDQRGDLKGAQAAFEEAAASTSKMLQVQPSSPGRIYDHAQSVFWIGYVARRRGDLETARQRFVDYKSLTDRLVRMQPSKPEWLVEELDAHSNLGTVLLEEGRAQAALLAFSRALEISRELARRSPSDRDRQMDLAQSHAWVADAQTELGALDQALVERNAELTFYETRLKIDPADTDTAVSAAVNLTVRGRILMQQGRTDLAAETLHKAVLAANRLIADNPGNVGYLNLLSPTYQRLAECLLRQGRLYAAAAASSRAAEVAAAVLRRDPESAPSNRARLTAVRLLQMRISAQLARSAAARRSALAPAESEAEAMRRIETSRPYSARIRRTAALAALLAGDFNWTAGATAPARLQWVRARDILGRTPGGWSALERTLEQQVLCRLNLPPERSPLDCGSEYLLY